MLRKPASAFLASLIALAAIAAPPADPPPETETGIASWYGYPYHGRQAAGGEIYDMEKLTAAHRTLPFNTHVRVFNLENRKSVDVRITDRGPFIDGRVIDLSKAAARAIDLVRPGITPVRLEILDQPEEASGPGRFAVQVAAFRDPVNAERCMREMRSRYGSARIALRNGDPVMHRVLVGAEPTQFAARGLRSRTRAQTGFTGAFIVRLDN